MPSKFAVGFDFDHTLGLDNKLEKTVALELLSAYASEHGVLLDSMAVNVAIEETLASYRVGTLTPEIAIAAFLERFVPVTGSAVMDKASGFRDAVMARASQFITAMDGARALIDDLSARGVPVALLTNGWSPFQEEKARLTQFPGSVFVSERIGVRKPAREAFAFLIQHFALDPVDIWFVGDDPVADCDGARAAGLTTVWFDWEHITYPSDIAQPHHTIRRLDELSAILPGRD